MTRFKVITGESSTDLENNINAWVQEMQGADLGEPPGGVTLGEWLLQSAKRFRLGAVVPLPMGGEILYVLARYDVG